VINNHQMNNVDLVTNVN